MGSQEAIDALLHHREWVHAIARAVVFGHQDVADVEQEAWLAAVRQAPRESTLQGWFKTVLRRTAVRVRARERKRHEVEGASGPSWGACSASASDVVVQAELHQDVVRAVLGLAEPYRETLLLRFFDGLPVKGVAQRMGAPVETVRSRLRRGLAMLKTALDRGDPSAWRLLLVPLPVARLAKTGGGPAAAALLVGLAATAAILIGIRVQEKNALAERNDAVVAGEAFAPDRGAPAATPVPAPEPSLGEPIDALAHAQSAEEPRPGEAQSPRATLPTRRFERNHPVLETKDAAARKRPTTRPRQGVRMTAASTATTVVRKPGPKHE